MKKKKVIFPIKGEIWRLKNKKGEYHYFLDKIMKVEGDIVTLVPVGTSIIYYWIHGGIKLNINNFLSWYEKR